MKKENNSGKITNLYNKLSLYLSGGDSSDYKEVFGTIKDVKKFGMLGDLKIKIDRRCFYMREKFTEKEIPLNIEAKIDKTAVIRYKDSVLGITNYLLDGFINFGFKIPMNYKRILKINIFE